MGVRAGKLKTSKGYTLTRLSRAYDPVANHWNQYSARVRVVEGNPFFDQIVRWDLDGNAINHELGDISWISADAGRQMVKQGENIFKDLR